MDQELENKLLCILCIGEKFLKNLVSSEGKEGTCSYCNEIAPITTLGEIAEKVETAFEQHFTRTADEPNSWQYALLKDKECDYDWYREGKSTTYAIIDAVKISEEIASDLQSILSDKYFDRDTFEIEESEFSEETHYEEIMPDDEEWQKEWNSFEKTIKFNTRFFSKSAETQLSNLFDTINEMHTSEGQSLIVDAGPETKLSHIYRARIFQSDEKLIPALKRPDIELGAPPAHLANAGRMNANGISVFYGATSVETTLAEVRPPVGSKVAVASFNIIRPLKLLDLTALRKVHETGSIFDPEYANRLGRMQFLKKLSRRMSRPIMPEEQEAEYLPTQVIADFLASKVKTPLDGILYPSVQINGLGLNVVLFHKAAKCKELEYPAGTVIDAHTYTTNEDGREIDYSVFEKIPAEKNTSDEKTSYDPFDIDDLWYEESSDYNHREDTLSIDTETMKVHHIKAITINTIDHQVRRYCYTDTSPDF